MSSEKYRLQQRLDKIQDAIESDRFLKRERIGGEIAFWIFDYPAEFEIEAREHISGLVSDLGRKQYQFLHLNLFEIIVEMLEERGLLEKSYDLEKNKGTAALRKALKAPLDQEKVADFIGKKVTKAQQQFVLLSGLGSAWPLVRGHALLNALHSRLGDVPMVLFYPGIYSGTDLKTFGVIESNNYYRAFNLVPDETDG